MAEKNGKLSYDSAVNNGKKPPVNTENNPESEEIQAADDTGALGSGEGSGSAATSKENVNKRKRGKGRPRKHEKGVPNIVGSSGAFPIPAASSSRKRARGRPKGTGRWQVLASVGGYMNAAEGGFTPHVLSVYTGEDLLGKVASFCILSSRSVCILAASGVVSCVTLRKPGSSIGNSTYEGRFEILTLTGTSVVSFDMGTHRKSCLLSVSLAHSDGRVFGGSVVGPLIAAGPGPIQLIVASFMRSIISHETRRNYSASTSADIFACSEMVNVPIRVAGMADGKENCTPPPSSPAEPLALRANPTKADSAKSENVTAENHDFNSSPVSQPMSDEMTLDSNPTVPEMHVED